MIKKFNEFLNEERRYTSARTWVEKINPDKFDNSRPSIDKFDKLYSSVWKDTLIPKLKKWNRNATPNQAEELYKKALNLYDNGKIKTWDEMEMFIDRELDNYPIK